MRVTRRLQLVRRRRRRDERGAIVVITALLTCMVLMLVAALTVDLGNTWARRGQLQTQADNASVFAANYLPATTPAARLVAAKAAVHYLACHPVVGQSTGANSTYAIPRTATGEFYCPSKSFDPASTTYDAAASALIAQGFITFPNRFEISVTTPWAKVQYGFARMAGVDNTEQRKSATAHVYSPGSVVPMGGSLGCIAAAANNTGLLGVGDTLSKLMPINYWSAGNGANTPPSSGPVGVTWPAAPPLPVAPAVLSTTNALVAGSNVTVSYNNASGLGGLTGVVTNLIGTGLLARNVTVWFGRGTTNYAVSAPITVLGSVTVAIPAAVLSSPGVWHVKVVSPMATAFTLLPLNVTYQNRQSTDSVPIDIGVSGLSDVTSLDNLMSCARPIIAPRNPAGASEEQDLIANIRKGVDHGYSAHPDMVTAAGGLTNLANTSVGTLVNGALKDPSGFALSCGSNLSSVMDSAANAATAPNCVKTSTKSWNYAFTQGFLTNAGRLSCSLPGNCTHGSFNGSDLGMSGQYNDDEITDYISAANKQTVLNDLLFTSLDTMLQTSVPVLTPNNQVSSDIYSSPRFFWSPVLTTVYTSPNVDAYYPVLTFRPAFLTQDSTQNPSGAYQLLNTLALELRKDLLDVQAAGINVLGLVRLDTILGAIGLNSPLATLLTQLQDPHAADKVERHGLVVDKTKDADRRLQAVRVMNINPGALPAVDPNYTGPVTDYLGSGPRVIRLVH